jgi:drug/metabolite transporter (DMT)-like permease
MVARQRLRTVFLIPLKNYYQSALMGFLNPFLYYLALLKAYDLLRAQEAGTLNYIWPLVLTLLSIPVLGQKISWKSIVAIFISFSGIIIISTRGRIHNMQFDEPVGVILAVGSAFIWAIYWLINMKDHRDTTPKLTLNFLFGLLYISLYLIIIKGRIEIPSLYGLLGGIYVGIFELGLTFIIWLQALRTSINTAKVSQLMYLSPFISLFFIQFIVKEPVILPTIAGLVLIVGGIVMQHYVDRQKQS